jgi:cytochrome c oxidase subunit 5b
MECGSTYKMHYVGPADDAHGHGHHAGMLLVLLEKMGHMLMRDAENLYPKPKTMADFLKPEYLSS